VCAFRDVTSSNTPVCSIHQGDFFYVVESGHVNFVDGAEIVGSCTEGGSFGELALL
jgi:CRP-like cAMP-binding protein